MGTLSLCRRWSKQSTPHPHTSRRRFRPRPRRLPSTTLLRMSRASSETSTTPASRLSFASPSKLNGVPLRRVPQSYVIGTQTTVDVSGVKLPAEVNDDLFKKPQSAKKQKKDEDFYEDGAKKPNTIDESRKALQKTVDTAVLASINKTPMLKQYIASRFSPKNGDKPHLMTF